jgi:hypothetical protein
MKKTPHDQHLTQDLSKRSEITPEVIACYVARTLSQARSARKCIEATVIPHIPPLHRGFAIDILRRINGTTVLEEHFLRDIEIFIENLESRVRDGTTAYWQGDDHHIDGGYEVVMRDDNARALSTAVQKLGVFRDSLVTAMAAIEAVRAVEDLLGH